MTEEVEVIFQPSGRRVYVLSGTILLEAAARAGFIVDTPCGGTGKCGKCRVRVTGELRAAARELEILGGELVADGYRLACTARIEGPVSVEVPESSLFESGLRILVDGGAGAGAAHAADEATGYGVAFDIGTTTLVGTLVDLETGADKAIASAANPQIQFGDDVISRITKCREDSGATARLQGILVNRLNELVEELCREGGIGKGAISRAVCAGNTAMEHILCGFDPSSLGELPFEPVSMGPERIAASKIGLSIGREAWVYVLPVIGGFVGGDTVAGILASRLDGSEAGTVLFIDIGTNGELVLAHEGELAAASVAAGPAFEGARIACGMRATGGAIEKVVVVAEDLRLNVIGNVRPRGICGTGLVDLMAELLRLGVIDVSGRLLDGDELDAGVPAAIRERLVASGKGLCFQIADGAESASGAPLSLCQKDIREVQLANGAVRAGTNVLLKMRGLAVSDLDAVLVAGAFGNFIRRKNARRIGMLPAIESARIRYIGNASSFGAKRALLSGAERERAESIVKRIKHVDLSADSGFQMEFGDAMIFPGAEVDSCA